MAAFELLLAFRKGGPTVRCCPGVRWYSEVRCCPGGRSCSSVCCCPDTLGSSAAKPVGNMACAQSTQPCTQPHRHGLYVLRMRCYPRVCTYPGVIRRRLCCPLRYQSYRADRGHTNTRTHSHTHTCGPTPRACLQTTNPAYHPGRECTLSKTYTPACKEHIPTCPECSRSGWLSGFTNREPRTVSPLKPYVRDPRFWTVA